jgi:cytochrome oxidase Cu insertion factor (SCO1/SenC/PrrC family)
VSRRGPIGDRGPLLALAAVLAVTALWWTLALWPLSDAAPSWVERARAVCFGTTETGLPDAAGWIALIVQPAVMLGIVFSVWGRGVTAGLRRLARSPLGRVALGTLSIALLGSIILAGYRIQTADAEGIEWTTAGPIDHPLLEQRSPTLRLVSQHGEVLDLSSFRGRPVLVTFAFGHCQTVCPLVVHEALAAQRALADLDTALVVVTLDPWRDTPTRLQHIASAWDLGTNSYILSGSVTAVNQTLDAWRVARSRDQRTGDIIHPPLVLLIDRAGTIAHATRGDARTIEQLTRTL